MSVLPRILLCLLACGLFAFVSAQPEHAARLPLQKGHTHDILEIKWSPNDKLAFTYSAADGFLYVWQMPHGKLLAAIEDSKIKNKGDEKHALRAFAWSDDSRLIATGSENGSAQVWEAESGKLLWTKRIANEYVTAVRFSRDYNHLAVATSPEDQKHRLFLLDATNGRIVKEFGATEEKSLNHGFALSFSGNNSKLTVGDINGTVADWHVANGLLIRRTKLTPCGRARGFNNLEYSDDVSLLVARCGLKTEIIDTTTGSLVREVMTNADYTRAVVISRDNQRVAISETGQVKLVNLANGEEVNVDADFFSDCGCDFSNDHSLLAWATRLPDHRINVLDLNTKRFVAHLHGHPGEIRSLTFSPDGRVLVSGSEDAVVRFWDAQTGSLLKALTGHSEPVRVVTFTPDGKRLASASEDETLKIWDVATGKLLHTMETKWPLTSVAFSPDGKRMVATHNTLVGLWDVSDWTLLIQYTTTEERRSGDMIICCGSTANSARFDARGQRIISGHVDGTIKVWNPNPPGPLPLPGSELDRVVKTADRNDNWALSPNEEFLVATPGAAAPTIWNWSRGELLRSLGKKAEYVHQVVFSPDSQLVATSNIGGEIFLWNVSTGKLVREFDGGYSSDDALAFSPDGSRLASGGDNQNILMWDVKTGKRLWHLLPIRERYRPTAKEIVEARRMQALAQAKARRIEQHVQTLKKNVFVKFSHFGDTVNRLQTQMAATDTPKISLAKRSEAEASGIWLRLHNNSRLPIEIGTDSIYLPVGPAAKCGYQTREGRFFHGLCNDGEIGIRFGVVDAKGEGIPWGGHVGGISMLSPNTSVVFEVPKELLRDGRKIVVGFRFLQVTAKGKLEGYGEARELMFSKANLP